MDFNKDIYGLLRKIVYTETLFLRHWTGTVVDDQDPSNRGRVKVTVPELGFLTDAQGFWASPRQGYSLQPPKPGEAVEVYFIGGDRRRAVYLIGVGEIAGNTPAQYTEPKKRLLWQDVSTGDYIQYDEEAKELEISMTTAVTVKKYGTFKWGAGSQAFTLGDALATYLAALKVWIDAHTHSAGGSGPPSAPSPAIPTIKSTTIKGE